MRCVSSVTSERILGLLASFGIVLGLVVLAGCGGEEEPPPSPINLLPAEEEVVIVDRYAVTGAWLRNWCATQLINVQAQTQGLAQVDEYEMIQAGRELLTKMVAVAIEAERRGIVIDEPQLRERLSAEMARFESTKAWLDTLEESGLDRDARREHLRLELLFQAYENEILGPEVSAEYATPEMAKKYYERYRDDFFVRPRQVHVFHLMRRVDRDAAEQERGRERERTAEARERFLAGEAFEDLAKELSTDKSALKGGEIGWVTKEFPTDEKLRETMLALEPGKISEVTPSALGFHLFYAKDVKPGGIVPFDEAREEIQARLFKQAMNRAMTIRASEILDQLIANGKVRYLNLTPYIGRALTPRENVKPEVAAETAE